MTTREGTLWLLIFSARGHFVARYDSPAGREARKQRTPSTQYDTLAGAYLRLGELRQQREQGR